MMSEIDCHLDEVVSVLSNILMELVNIELFFEDIRRGKITNEKPVIQSLETKESKDPMEAKMESKLNG